ncbi:tyrosine-type recombinase/integrase [Streptomyces antibioticus]|uniref:tyrosine-type recombinase/integrase n=1 Tax=Streptomyces antibioticus TaxID=1890 RepID=UPI0037022F9B
MAKQAAGELWSDYNFVFTTRYGTPFEPRTFNRRFMDRTARADVRRIRLHNTRHTCGSLLAALDVHPRVAMQILRHSKIAVTMDVYTRRPPAGRSASWASILGSKIRSSCCTSLLYGMAKAPVGRPDRGFELRGPEGI